MTATVKGRDYYAELSQGLAANGYYKDLPIYALPKIHALVCEKLTKLMPKESSVLDLAAGSGAMCKRLLDAGFHVEGADLFSDGFRLKDSVTLHQADFNTHFSTQIPARYDAITAMEIIEHIENPRHLLRECHHLLKPGGILIVTTPNIETPRSVLRFVTKGQFRQFDEVDYVKSGHITPVSQWQMEKMIEEGKWECLEFTSCGAAFGKGLRHLGAKAITALMVGNKRLRGAALIAILRKPS